MKTDRIFVLLLVVMLPMSGCFDDAVGDAEAEEDSTGSTVNHYNNTTVVNHHYHNNTTADAGPEYFVVGGTLDNDTTNVPRIGQIGTYYYPYNFSTNSGQTLYVHYLMQSDANSIALRSDCGDGGEWTVFSTQTNFQEHHNGYWIAGSAYDCQHSLEILAGYDALGNTEPPYYFSLIYSIEEMTVIPVTIG